MNSELSIAGFDAANNPIRFIEAQVKVDSTGRAADVLKRLQIRMPLYEEFLPPQYALEAMNGICKRLGVYPGYANNSECAYPSGSGNGINTP